ncbi:uncharacterized protein LOC142340185 [Convolutriloba macropyga]|uniref:uncharacterized protein LOC142340185 n=1 Tax=Convolutriloba macropyga TaxID=536237 RepID=UPI003F522CB8
MLSFSRQISSKFLLIAKTMSSHSDLRRRLDDRRSYDRHRPPSSHFHSHSRSNYHYNRYQGSSSYGNNRQSRPTQNRNFYFRNVDYSKMSRSEVLEDLVKVEKHHIENVFRSEDSSNRIEDVKWCPSYMERGEHCTGGTRLPHHKCRLCNKIAIHLVDTKGRPCLRCYGWHRDDIPSWYYHKGCRHCASPRHR